jgi:small subunit ribosomal protein S18
MPRKTNTDKPDRRGSRRSTGSSYGETRTPRPKPKVDFTIDALDFKNTNLLKQYVTDQGRILPRKYTGLPAHYQRKLNRAIKRARQMLLVK